MKADKKKLKDADELDIVLDLSKIRDELSNEMWPPSWARTQELLEYASELFEELAARKMTIKT